MAFIPVPAGIQVEVRYTIHGQKAENVYWIAGFDNPTASELEMIGTGVYNVVVANHMPNLSQDVELREIYVTDQSVQNGVFKSIFPGAQVIGGDLGTCRNAAEALCVTLRTDKRGRSFTGRSYLFGYPSSHLDNSEWDNTVVAQALGFIGSLRTGITSMGYALCVCSRYHNKVARTSGILTPVTAHGIVDQVVDSQNSRKPGRGD